MRKQSERRAGRSIGSSRYCVDYCLLVFFLVATCRHSDTLNIMPQRSAADEMERHKGEIGENFPLRLTTSFLKQPLIHFLCRLKANAFLHSSRTETIVARKSFDG